MGDTLTQDADLRQLLDVHAEAFFQAFHAPIQGRVHTYSTSPARVDVQPLVALRVEGSTVLTPAPILRSVPVIFPGGAIAGYTFPLTPGADTVALLPQDADIGAYVASGAVNQLPQSKRRFSLSDAIAIPNNLRAGGQPLPATAFAADGGVLWGKHYVGSSAGTQPVGLNQDTVVKANVPPDLMTTWMAQVETVVNVVAPGAVTPLSTTFTQVGKIVATATKLRAV